jgi:AraC-like DNA-binding protein
MNIKPNNLSLITYLLPYLRYAALDEYENSWKLPERIIYDHEFLLITQGDGYFTIDGYDFTVKPGDLVLFKPQVKHSGHSIHNAFKFICIHFDIYATSNIDNSLIPRSEINTFVSMNNILSNTRVDFNKSILDFTICHTVLDKEIINLFHKILLEKKRKLYGWEKICISSFTEILTRLSREIIKSHLYAKESFYSKDSQIECSLDFIHKNYASDLTVKKLADMAHVTPEYFSKIFKDNIGISPIQYILFYRITQARLLLQDKCNKIEWVGRQCGFSDIHYFSRVFKKYEGISPSQYQHTILK